jgi:hypothetical protein
MPIDLHFICKRNENYEYLGDSKFESGNWVATDLLSSLAIGGKIFLHISQREPAWIGGTILDYRPAPKPQERRKVFICHRDFDYKLLCPVPWAREKAVARWNSDRTETMTARDYIKAIKSQRPELADTSPENLDRVIAELEALPVQSSPE